MLTDNEIKKMAEDALGFAALAKTMEEIICSSETPITLGVYGEWGSGKTSLMRMTEDLLKEKKIKTVWFDAWKFDKTYDLRVALIHTILRKINEDKTVEKKLKEKVDELLKRINWLGLGKAVFSALVPLPSALQNVDFLKNPEEIPGKTLELIGDFEDRFREITAEYTGDKGRIVIFIDDLDRCLPEKAVDVLEAIKLFLNVENSVFVIGADKKVIEDGILQKYGERSEDWGRNYLDKIIQIPVNLPPLRKDIITEKFIEGLSVSSEIKKYASIIAEVGDNPRTIKRLLNRFEILRILAEKRELKVESGVLAKLIVIEFRWPDFYTDLISVYCESQTNLIQILKEVSENEAERERRLGEWTTLRKYFENRMFMRFLLEEPQLVNIDLDQYVYMIRSTMELKESAESYFTIAYSFGERGDYVKEIENYDKALELNPKNVDAWNNKGSALKNLRKYEEALSCYDRVLELDPGNADAWNNKGFALRNLREYKEALSCFDKALELDSKYVDAWNNKGISLGNLGKYEEALSCFDKALELDSKYVDVWYNKGATLRHLGKNKEAAECFEEAEKLRRDK